MNIKFMVTIQGGLLPASEQGSVGEDRLNAIPKGGFPIGHDLPGNEFVEVVTNESKDLLVQPVGTTRHDDDEDGGGYAVEVGDDVEHLSLPPAEHVDNSGQNAKRGIDPEEPGGAQNLVDGRPLAEENRILSALSTAICHHMAEVVVREAGWEVMVFELGDEFVDGGRSRWD